MGSDRPGGGGGGGGGRGFRKNPRRRRPVLVFFSTGRRSRARTRVPAAWPAGVGGCGGGGLPGLDGGVLHGDGLHACWLACLRSSLVDGTRSDSMLSPRTPRARSFFLRSGRPPRATRSIESATRFGPSRPVFYSTSGVISLSPDRSIDRDPPVESRFHVLCPRSRCEI